MVYDYNMKLLKLHTVIKNINSLGIKTYRLSRI